MEMMVSMAVFSIIMVLIFQAISAVTRISTQSSSRVGSFSAARAGFEALTRNLAQATLRSYHSSADVNGIPVPMFNPSASGASYLVPSQYVRSSELHFIIDKASDLLTVGGATPVDSPGYAVFFQAPLGYSEQSQNQGLYGLLNICGYYIDFSSDKADQPAFLQPMLTPQYRYRLMEVRQPAEEDSIYASTQEINATTGKIQYNYDLNWIKNLQLNNPSSRRVLAENVVELVLLPRYSNYNSTTAGAAVKLAPNFVYDTRSWEPGYGRSGPKTDDVRNKLPPVVEVVLIAIDEAGASLMAKKYGGPDGSLPPFQQGSVKSVIDFSSLFKKADQLDSDLDTARQGLTKLGVPFRIFRSSIVINESL